MFQPIDELLDLSPLANLHIDEQSVPSNSQLRSCLAFAKLPIYKIDTSNGCQAKPAKEPLQASLKTPTCTVQAIVQFRQLMEVNTL